jgi:hypothetical protein
MNQFFSIQRFSLLVAKHWADNKKRYVLAILAFMGLLVAWFVFTLLTFHNEPPMDKGVQQVTYFLSCLQWVHSMPVNISVNSVQGQKVSTF